LPGQDLAQLQRAHGCAEVVLRLTFKRGARQSQNPTIVSSTSGACCLSAMQ
jgi:hypothetical protein